MWHYFPSLSYPHNFLGMPQLTYTFFIRTSIPANIRLDEDVFVKTNMFALALRLQKMFSRRLQDVLVKTNIFVLAIPLQEVFKTFSRRLAKTSSRRLAKTSSRHLQDVLQKRLQDIFKTSCKDIFKTFSRRIIKLNCSC